MIKKGMKYMKGKWHLLMLSMIVGSTIFMNSLMTLSASAHSLTVIFLATDSTVPPSDWKDPNAKWSVEVDGHLNNLSYLYIDGVLTYCIEPLIGTQNGESYITGDINGRLNIAQKRELEIIGYTGHGYGGDYSKEMYAATQVRIWQYLGGNVTYIHSDIQAKLDILNNRVANFRKNPSFSNQTITLEGIGKQYAVTVTDTNGVFSDTFDKSSGGFHYERNGNSLKIWVEEGDKYNSSTGIEFNRYDATRCGNSILYESMNNMQDVATFRKGDPETFRLKVLVKRPVELYKFNSDGSSGSLKPLADCTFTFQLKNEVDTLGKENAPVYARVITNKDGYVKTDPLLDGIYLISEVDYPTGVQKVEDFLYTLDSSSVSIPKIFLNDGDFKAYVKIVKKDFITGNNVMLKGTSFKIYDFQKNDYLVQKVGDKKVDTFTTDETGTITTPLSVKGGKYELREVKVAGNYILNTENLKFTIDSHNGNYELDEDNVPVVTLTMQNKTPTGEIILHKSDENTKLDMGGVRYQLTANEDIFTSDNTNTLLYAKGESVSVDISEDGYYMTNELGEIYIAGLPLGSYKLEEVSTLDGYVLDEKPMIIEFKYENETKEVYTSELDVTNQKTKVDISKRDKVTNRELAGAKMVAIDKKTGIVIDEWVSDIQAHRIEGLKVGQTIIIHEKNAPNGYELAKDIEYTIQNKKSVQIVIMEDVPKAIEAGDKTNLIKWLGLIGLSSIVLSGLYAFRKKKDFK